jgi:hypothetical protein
MIIPVWVYPASAAALLAIGAVGGWTAQGWRCDAAKAEALERAQRRFNKQLDAIHTAATEYERNRERGQAETRERETKVREIYRDVQVPAECEPGPDALRLLDDALDAAAKASG